MSQLNTHLKQLVALACSCAPKSSERQKYQQDLYYAVTSSKRLWKAIEPYYADALQDMWEYCYCHLNDYEPERAEVITWLNANLRRLLRRYHNRYQRNLKRHYPSILTTEKATLNPIDLIPASHDVSPAMEMFEKTLDWLQTDPEGVLQTTCFRKRAEINAQVLILKRFPDKTPWKVIATEFDLSSAEAIDLPKFYNRCCLPLLKAFGRDNGYLDT